MERLLSRKKGKLVFVQGLPVHPFGHSHHSQQNNCQKSWQDGKGKGFSEQAEERAHERRAHVGAGHLDADDALAVLLAEVARRLVQDGGIDGRAAQAEQHQRRQEHPRAGRKRQQEHAHCADGLAEADHVPVVHA